MTVTKILIFVESEQIPQADGVSLQTIPIQASLELGLHTLSFLV